MHEYKVFYLRDEKKFPVACVAYRKFDEVPTQGVVAFALSTHNPADTYSKKYGRQLAIGRLFEAENDFGIVLLESPDSDPRVSIVMSLAKNESVPLRARAVAVRWARIEAHKNMSRAARDVLRDSFKTVSVPTC